MNHRRRVSVVLLACLVTSLLVLAPTPAEAKRKLNLHRGSHGPAVTVLETRLARLGLMPATAIDRKFRVATVYAVRRFQAQLGLRVTGRVNRAVWNTIAREPSRRAGIRAPRVIGHRGAVGGSLAENTLESLTYAAPWSDVLEFDLHLTADDQLVLMHDHRLDRTTNCSGLVRAWTLADLTAQCRAGGEEIPTFEQAAAYAASVGKTITPELKDGAMSREEIEHVVDVIRDHGLASRTWVQSYYGSHLLELRQVAPDVRTALVSGGAPGVAVVRSLGAKAVAARLTSLTIPRVHAYHRAGIQVWGWTARTGFEIDTARAMVCDAVVTDVPRWARLRYR